MDFIKEAKQAEILLCWEYRLTVLISLWIPCSSAELDLKELRALVYTFLTFILEVVSVKTHSFTAGLSNFLAAASCTTGVTGMCRCLSTCCTVSVYSTLPSVAEPQAPLLHSITWVFQAGFPGLQAVLYRSGLTTKGWVMKWKLE